MLRSIIGLKIQHTLANLVNDFSELQTV